VSYDPILNARLARERHQDYLREAAQRRLAARARAGRLTLSRRAARPLGQVLLRLGAILLRYGQAEQPAAANSYRSSVGSIEWN
jgi:hypothetical protein